MRDALETQEAAARERVNHLSKKLHHLRSTATCAGIYNSAYHVGHHPTAFGVPVEEHLRTAIRPVIKARSTLTLNPNPNLTPTLPLPQPDPYPNPTLTPTLPLPQPYPYPNPAFTLTLP